MIDDAVLIVPVYLVIDVSASMVNAIPEVNEAIRSAVSLLESEPLATERVRLSVISFSDTAEVVLPLTRADHIQAPPVLNTQSGTSYGPVLQILRETIAIDVDRLKDDGCRVARPIIFFLTDGQPMDKWWLVELKALIDSKYRPTLVAFGVGAADPQVLVQVASRPELAFMAQRQVDQDLAVAIYGQTVQDYFRSLSRSTRVNAAEVQISVDARFSVVPSDINTEWL
jgi:uncharacterized protein YegL